MQSSDNLEIRNNVQISVLNYYKYLSREARYFLESKDDEWGWTNLHFLVDKIHVIRYGFGSDRGALRGGVALGIGPHYFGPESFWSYEDSLNFLYTVDTDSIFHNLRLMDEFWKRSIEKSKFTYQVK